jgi:acyl carrier protein
MKDKDELVSIIKNIIISVSDIPLTVEQIEIGKGGIMDLGLNSLSLVRMMAEIEKQFDIDLEDAGSNILNSIEDLADYILNISHL